MFLSILVYIYNIWDNRKKLHDNSNYYYYNNDSGIGDTHATSLIYCRLELVVDSPYKKNVNIISKLIYQKTLKF